jgi:pimeloyl-ACP methyl ester carboxylesterase
VTTPDSKKLRRHLRFSDIRGIAQLATEATRGVTRIVEGVHHSVLNTMGISGRKETGQTRGLTGIVYRSIHGGTRLLGKGLDASLSGLEAVLGEKGDGKAATPEREALLAALNGVMGDRLVASDNPFAISMTLHCRDRVLNGQSMRSMSAVSGKVMLLVHGLCMNDLRSHALHQDQSPDHGEVLASALGYTPVYLRYNSGLHISQNGRELAAQLEQLVTQWPTPIKELTVVAYSMGGLLTRSSVHYAKEQGLNWPNHLKNIVFLGTPHHGAPLEKMGNWLDALLGITPFSKPFAKLGQMRSAGITDLRYGHVLDDDWQDLDRFDLHFDQRRVLPLPDDVACYTLAAVTSEKPHRLANRLIGDGLVPLHSALGHHDDTRKVLSFANDAQWTAHRTSHMQLLSSPNVSQRIVHWLSPAQSRSSSAISPTTKKDEILSPSEARAGAGKAPGVRDVVSPEGAEHHSGKVGAATAPASTKM